MGEALLRLDVTSKWLVNSTASGRIYRGFPVARDSGGQFNEPGANLNKVQPAWVGLRS
jgi:hypothetical protein